MIRTIFTLAALVMSSAVVAETTIETAKGPVVFESVPQMVAAYDVAAIDTLVALGVKPVGVIEKLFVNYLDEVGADAAKIGNIFEPDLEALNALSPDLTIVGGRSAGQLDAISEVSSVIDMTISGDTVEQGLARLEAYGALFGKEDVAAKLRSDLEAKIESTRANLENAGTAMILMTNGPEVSAYGESGRFGWLHSLLGLPAAAPINDSNHGEAVSFEFIRDANPDVLFVIDRLAAIGKEGEAAQAVLDNALVQETNAWKNGKVIYLDAAAVYIAAGGVQAMDQTLDTVNAGFAD